MNAVNKKLNIWRLVLWFDESPTEVFGRNCFCWREKRDTCKHENVHELLTGTFHKIDGIMCLFTNSLYIFGFNCLRRHRRFLSLKDV